MADGVVDARSKSRLYEVILDEASIARAAADVEHERAVAIYDLVEENEFQPVGYECGPYRLRLALVDQKMVFDIADAHGAPVVAHILSMTPFRRIVKDYFMICESYFAAIKTSTASQIETIDMARRGVHNDGSQVLIDRLAGKIAIDFNTARRLFTLICALHWKG